MFWVRSIVFKWLLVMEVNIFFVGYLRKDRNGLEGKRVYILYVYMDDGEGVLMIYCFKLYDMV